MAEKKGPPVFVQTATPEQPELDNWQQITEEEARVAYEMTLRNELSGGTPTVREFEKEWREWTGLRYAITTMNGSTALYSAYFGLGVGPGDEVICPTYTWICTIAPAVFLGARPVFVESDPRTLQIDPEDVRRKVTDKTRAIVAVHLWGNVCNMDELMAVSRDTGVPVVEDCSHAHGARYKGKPVGTFGHVAAWSLQGSKAVSAGEGGVLATNDEEIFERACLAGQVNRMGGLDLVTERYADLQPLGLGMKFRAHPLGIGIARVQLRKLPELNRRRAAYVEAVEEGLREMPGLEPVATYEGSERGGFYGFPTIHRPEEHHGLSTQRFIAALREAGLNAGPSPYGLLHRLKIFAEGFDVFTRGRGPLTGDYPGYKEGDFPVTEGVFERLVFLPILSDPVPGAVEKILGILRDVTGRAAKGELS
ncbi:MAG: DegT/DnrJ/EryC1/StrS family aminotransferase [Calditrichaeota bacterium]|nr:DegT/DnrJ/EryC1/StrS family aminotransferase [Calditrichota bacterium]